MMEFVRWIAFGGLFFSVGGVDGDRQRFGSCGVNGGGRKRIVGGERVVISDYPWIGVLRDDLGRIYCGAAIIHEYFVLSAAHCFKWEPNASVTVTYGTDELDFKRENSRKVVKFIRPANYDPNAHHDDIMLVKVDNPINFTSDVQPVCLPDNKEDLEATGAEVMGFGRLEYNGRLSDSLQAVYLNIVPNDVCTEIYDSTLVLPINVCAGGELGKDACQGDSGAPLVMKKDMNYYIIGVVSYGLKCALEGKPGVYTRVSSYMDWIYDVIQREMQ